MIYLALVERLGFDSYAGNLVVNLIEDGLLSDGYRHETDDCSLAVTLADGRYHVAVRAYVPTMGWQTADVII